MNTVRLRERIWGLDRWHHGRVNIAVAIALSVDDVESLADQVLDGGL